MSKKAKTLNSQQLAFCNAVADGDSNTRAYRRAYKGCNSDQAASGNATKLLGNALVIEKIDELRLKSQTDKCLTRQKVREIRFAIADDKKAKDRDRLAACADEAKMMGWDEADQVNMNFTGELVMNPIEFVIQNKKLREAAEKAKKNK